MKIENRFTDKVIFECASKTMRETVLEALKQSADLSGAYLFDADLSGADLSGAYLFDAYLSGADLSGADLSGANLSGAKLSDANLFDADLSGADLSGAYLFDADLSGADLSGANLSGAKLSDANLSGAKLSGAKLSDADLSVLSQIEKMPIRAAICAQVCAAPEKLEMDAWHTCDTVHCIAGWAVTLHPQGKLLEAIYGTSAAAALILHVCEGEVPDFHSDNETAMRWIQGAK